MKKVYSGKPKKLDLDQDPCEKSQAYAESLNTPIGFYSLSHRVGHATIFLVSQKSVMASEICQKPNKLPRCRGCP